MFGDILMWVLTVFGLIPMLRGLFGPKKYFQEQLEEFSDDLVFHDADRFYDGGLGHLADLGHEDPANHDAKVARFFQEIGECGDEYRRFAMLEDFWDPTVSTRTISTRTR